jgi:hypothetical protein
VGAEVARAHWSLTAVWPAALTVTTPPQVQVQVHESSSALTPLIVTRAEPGCHGATSTGTHGWGAFAAATCGLDGDVHNPNGGTLASVMSVTTPAGPPAEVWMPEAEKVAGVVPNEHCSVAPVHTKSGMAYLLQSNRSSAAAASPWRLVDNIDAIADL